MTTEPDLVIDLFAGMGGWSVAAAAHGIHDIGIEFDEMACRTRVAAGHTAIMADVATFPLDHLAGRVEGLVASPPCTDWSQSGKRAGLDGESGGLVLEVDRWVRALRPRWVVCEQVPPALQWWNRFALDFQELGYSTWAGVLNSADYGVPQTRERAILICSLDRSVGPPPATHAKSPMPSLFGPELLPWVSMAQALGWGMTDRPYLTIASSNHSGGPDKEKLGGSGARAQLYREQQEGRWRGQAPEPDDLAAVIIESPGGTNRARRRPDEPSATIAFGHDAAGWVIQTRRGGDRLDESSSVDEPAPTITSRTDRFQVQPGEVVVGVNTGRDWKAGGTRDEAQTVSPASPAPTVDGKGRWHALVEQGVWPEDRPATTLQGDPRVFAPGGHIAYDGRDNTKMVGRSEHTIRLGIADALVLQSFDPDYPVVGNKTKQFEQVGNAIPPLLAWHVLAQVVSE